MPMSLGTLYTQQFNKCWKGDKPFTLPYTEAPWVWSMLPGKFETSASLKNWCMSPHRIAGPPAQSSRNSGSKCLSIYQTPNHAKFRHPLTRSVRDIRCRKFLIPKKWTKVHQNRRWPATHKCPSLCQISSRSGKPCTIKALQNLWKITKN